MHVLLGEGCRPGYLYLGSRKPCPGEKFSPAHERARVSTSLGITEYLGAQHLSLSVTIMKDRNVLEPVQRSAAAPKSMILMLPPAVMRMLSGLTSLCTMPARSPQPVNTSAGRIQHMSVKHDQQ